MEDLNDQPCSSDQKISDTCQNILQEKQLPYDVNAQFSAKVCYEGDDSWIEEKGNIYPAKCSRMTDHDESKTAILAASYEKRETDSHKHYTFSQKRDKVTNKESVKSQRSNENTEEHSSSKKIRIFLEEESNEEALTTIDCTSKPHNENCLHKVSIDNKPECTENREHCTNVSELPRESEYNEFLSEIEAFLSTLQDSKAEEISRIGQRASKEFSWPVSPIRPGLKAESSKKVETLESAEVVTPQVNYDHIHTTFSENEDLDNDVVIDSITEVDIVDSGFMPQIDVLTLKNEMLQKDNSTTELETFEETLLSLTSLLDDIDEESEITHLHSGRKEEDRDDFENISLKRKGDTMNTAPVAKTNNEDQEYTAESNTESSVCKEKAVAIESCDTAAFPIDTLIDNESNKEDSMKKSDKEKVIPRKENTKWNEMEHNTTGDKNVHEMLSNRIPLEEIESSKTEANENPVTSSIKINDKLSFRTYLERKYRIQTRSSFRVDTSASECFVGTITATLVLRPRAIPTFVARTNAKFLKQEECEIPSSGELKLSKDTSIETPSTPIIETRLVRFLMECSNASGEFERVSSDDLYFKILNRAGIKAYTQSIKYIGDKIVSKLQEYYNRRFTNSKNSKDNKYVKTNTSEMLMKEFPTNDIKSIARDEHEEKDVLFSENLLSPNEDTECKITSFSMAENNAILASRKRSYKIQTRSSFRIEISANEGFRGTIIITMVLIPKSIPNIVVHTNASLEKLNGNEIPSKQTQNLSERTPIQEPSPPEVSIRLVHFCMECSNSSGEFERISTADCNFKRLNKAGIIAYKQIMEYIKPKVVAKLQQHHANITLPPHTE